MTRLLPFALIWLSVAGCPKQPSDDAPLPDRLLQPGRAAPDPVAIPEAEAPPTPKDRSPLPPPPGGDPASRAVVLGRAAPESVLERLPNGGLRVGPITLSADRRSLRVPGRINQREGIIEYLAVGMKGKTHESVLVLDVEATQLMVGCLLLGLEPAPLTDQEDPGLRIVRRDGRADPAPPPRASGALVRLEVVWRDAAGKEVRLRAEELTWNRERKTSMRNTQWVFTGSQIWRGNFVAELEQSYVATWPDRSALFNSPWEAKNPYRGAAFGYEANAQVLPPVATPIELVITRERPAP